MIDGRWPWCVHSQLSIVVGLQAPGRQALSQAWNIVVRTSPIQGGFEVNERLTKLRDGRRRRFGRSPDHSA